jgi:hypothetical protein
MATHLAFRNFVEKIIVSILPGPVPNAKLMNALRQGVKAI